MLLIDSPADTSSYLILGLTMLAVIGGSYFIYLFKRFSKLKQQISTLEGSNNTTHK